MAASPTLQAPVSPFTEVMMSHGDGKVQVLIAEVLRGCGARPLSTLVWDVAERDGVVLTDGIDESVYNGIWRSARRLVDRRREAEVVRSERAILHLDELVRWSPDRTRDANVRAMRRRLLPHVGPFLRARGIKLRPLQSEDYVWKTGLFRTHPAVPAMRQHWARLETSLIRTLPSLQEPTLTIALQVIARGRATLSPPAGLTGEESFIEGILGLLAANAKVSLPDDLVADLQRARDLLPVDAYLRARMMAGLRHVVRLQKREPVSLEPEFRDYILKAEPEYVGWIETQTEWIEKPAKNDWDEPVPRRRRLLDQLIDRSTLRPLVWFSVKSPTSAV